MGKHRKKMPRRVEAPGSAEAAVAPSRLPEWAHWMLWAVAIFPVCWRQITTSDCWWSVALGRWLAERRSIPDYSVFYFTPVKDAVPDLRWTALGDLILYAFHRFGGAAALQTLAFAALALGCVVLRRLRSGPMNGWCTALFVAVAIGSYQLQLPRAALFSLPLMALLLWFYSRFRVTRRSAWGWAMAALTGLWSFTHGSYLLACVLTAVLLGIDALEGFRQSRAEFWQRARLATLILLATLAVVSVGNPSAMHMLRKPVDFVLGHSAPPAPAPVVAKKREKQKDTPRRSAAPVAAAEPRGVKEWLNNTIWRTEPGQVQSGDFDSPLDRLSYRPVVVSFALMALAAVWAGWTQRPQFAWIGAFLATSLLGLSYFRMSGYASLGAAALILSHGQLRGRVAAALAQSHWMGTALSMIVGAVVWISWWTGGLPGLLGNSRHVFAAGKVPTFDNAAGQWILDEHRERRVFTTIVTGSYALYQWKWQKQVFTDGFFAPHADAVWNDYARARREPARDLLAKRYGVELALIEHTRVDWNALFLNQREWEPVAIGAGCIVCGRSELARAAPPVLLCDERQVKAMAPVFRRAFARNYYAALLRLLSSNRPEAARALIDVSPSGYRQWRKWLGPTEAAIVPKLDEALGVAVSNRAR